MFEIKRRLNLQLFAEGATGDGGAGGAEGSSAAEGENPVVAGREWLKSRGATDAQIDDGRAEAVGKTILKERSEQAKANGKAGKQVAAAATENGEQQQTPWALPEGTTWDQLMGVDWVQQKMQDTVKQAKRDTKNATKAMEDLTPALEMLAKHHGLDVSNGLDYKALTEKILGDDSLYEAKALQMGVDIPTAKQMVQQEQQAAAANRQQTQSFQEEQLQNHYLGMVQEAKTLKDTYPGFDLNTELKNPAFARLTQPTVMQALGGLKGVYEAVHREELAKQRETAAAELARQQAAKAIQSGSGRPSEFGNGVSAAAPVKTTWTDAELEEYAARARRGEKIAL